jgi:hypothetical protein
MKNTLPCFFLCFHCTTATIFNLVLQISFVQPIAFIPSLTTPHHLLAYPIFFYNIPLPCQTHYGHYLVDVGVGHIFRYYAQCNNGTIEQGSIEKKERGSNRTLEWGKIGGKRAMKQQTINIEQRITTRMTTTTTTIIIQLRLHSKF